MGVFKKRTGRYKKKKIKKKSGVGVFVDNNTNTSTYTRICVGISGGDGKIQENNTLLLDLLTRNCSKRIYIAIATI